MANLNLRIPLSLLVICASILPTAAEGMTKEGVAALSAGCVAALVAILGLGMWFRDMYMRKYEDFENYDTFHENKAAVRAYTISQRVDADNYAFTPDTATY
ncbi:uncharacterized protein LOC144452973 [Glandiceps talaboti]